MTTRKRLGLRDSFALLLFQAALGGDDRRLQLGGGARLTVRVRNGVVSLTIARPDVPVGDKELITFRAHCNVPDDAERIPAKDQATREDERGRTWHLVTFRWFNPQYVRPANVPAHEEEATE